MYTVKDTKTIPSQSIIASDFESIDYFDSFSISVVNQRKYTVDYFLTEFVNFGAGWITELFKLRNYLVRIVGIKSGSLENRIVNDKQFKAGTSFGPFKILSRNEMEIVFYGNDKHLNFRSSILLMEQNGNQWLYSITLVHYNNALGRFYFFVVKPFHKLIIKSRLMSISKKSAE